MRRSIKFMLGVVASVAVMALAANGVKAQYDTTYDSSYDYTTDYTTSYDYGTYDYMTTTTELTPEQKAQATMVMVVSTIVSLVVGIGMYVYGALALSTIAKKLNVDGTWMAWVPFANIYLMTKCAGLETMHFVISLFFSPYVLYIFMKMVERRGFNKWLGCAVFIPVIGIAVPGYVAWGEPKNPAPVAQPVA